MNQSSRNRPRNNSKNRNRRPNNQQRRPSHGPRHQRHGDDRRKKVTPEEQKFLSGVADIPSPRIVLEKGGSDITVRAVDLITPIGMGQRALLVAPPGAGKTTILKKICNAVTTGYPEMKTHVVLVDERPEEVTDFKRSVTAEVHSSSMDHSHDSHIKMVDEVMALAFKEAAAGGNVFLLIDSLTRLARVHSNQHQGNSRTMSGGVPAGALDLPRKIFGAARRVEGMGSITIIATILVDTGSRMDQVIFQEFKGTGNMELVLARKLAERRVFPALNLRMSGTRRVETLFEPAEFRCLEVLYRGIGNADPDIATEKLLQMLEKYPDNLSLLKSLEKYAR